MFNIDSWEFLTFLMALGILVLYLACVVDRWYSRRPHQYAACEAILSASAVCGAVVAALSTMVYMWIVTLGINVQDSLPIPGYVISGVLVMLLISFVGPLSIYALAERSPRSHSSAK